MRYIDPHLHTILLDDGLLMKIALTGMEACVTPMLHCLNGLSKLMLSLPFGRGF